jgi:hypothetical protein
VSLTNTFTEMAIERSDATLSGRKPPETLNEQRDE